MLGFHNTLETFFRKNFHDEIQRLAVECSTPSSASRAAYANGNAPRHLSVIERRSLEPPLELSNSISRAPSISPRSTQANGNGQSVDGNLPNKQTPLQRGLAHLARHGFMGVASGPRDTSGSDIEEGSPHDSYMNGVGMPVANLSGAASITTSTMGSMGSLRGRFSRLGSLNFGRRD
jgi:dedicator of cytokinesis protein 3